MYPEFQLKKLYNNNILHESKICHLRNCHFKVINTLQPLSISANHQARFSSKSLFYCNNYLKLPRHIKKLTIAKINFDKRTQYIT